jgi:hypothetical protein
VVGKQPDRFEVVIVEQVRLADREHRRAAWQLARVGLVRQKRSGLLPSIVIVSS